jgi:hypothetical protein
MPSPVLSHKLPARHRVWTTLAAVFLALQFGSRGFAATLGLHPQDGPHVDLRLFIEDERVVVRIEMNLVFLDEMLDYPREDPNRISADEWPALQPMLEDHVLNANAVAIDGARAYPTLENLQINQPDLRLLPLFPYSGERGLRKIRFELVYPVAAPPPSSVSFEWDTYPPNILVDPVDPPPLAIAAELDAEGIRIPIVFSSIERGYTWHATGGDLDSRLLEVPAPVADEGSTFPALAMLLLLIGATPVVFGALASKSTGSTRPILIGAVIEFPFMVGAAACLLTGVGAVRVGGGPTLPDAVAAEAIFRPLHANVYRAFDYVEEGDIYDALARSADGEFLDSLYRTIFGGLVMQEEGGAVARVKDVRPISITVGDIGVAPDADGLERPVFTVECRWQVEGVVSHWGHAHSRTNEYLARWSVAEEADGWRLTGAEILEQDRVDESSTDPLAPVTGDEFEV